MRRAFDGFATIAGTLSWISSPRSTCSRKSRRSPHEHRTLLMTLTEIARSIAMKHVSSREVTRAFAPDRVVAAASQCFHDARIRCGAERRERGRCRACGRRGPRPPARRAARAQVHELRCSKVVTCGSAICRDFVATTTSTALRRLKNAGQIRLGSLHMAECAVGPTGSEQPLWSGKKPMKRCVHRRRLGVRLGLRSRRSG